jgi:hypothetical protein
MLGAVEPAEAGTAGDRVDDDPAHPRRDLGGRKTIDGRDGSGVFNEKNGHFAPCLRC